MCCTSCRAPWSRANLLSGNTFGGRVWDDGETAPTGVRATGDAMELGADDLFDAIDARIWRTPDEERTVRRLAWWLANDARRPPTRPPVTVRFRRICSAVYTPML